MRRPAMRRPRIPSRISLVDVLLWLLGGSIILFAVVGTVLTLQSTNLTSTTGATSSSTALRRAASTPSSRWATRSCTACCS